LKPTLLYQGTNEYGIVSVWHSKNINYITINGKIEGGTSIYDVKTNYFLGYLPMFMKPNAKKVLGIGLGTGGSLSTIKNFKVQQIDWIEINPLVVKAVRDYFSNFNDYVLNDTRLNLIKMDGRNYLLTSQIKYDVIISEPSNIWIKESNALFTKEFFEIVNDHLEEGGIFSYWIPEYEVNEGDLGIALNTIRKVFDHVSIWSYNGDIIILASDSKIMIDNFYLKNSIYNNLEIYSDFIELNNNSSEKGNPVINIENILLSGYVGEYEDLNLTTTILNTDDFRYSNLHHLRILS